MLLSSPWMESQGDLYRTDRPDWTTKPLRRNYCFTHAVIDSVADLKATLRAGQYTWPGGYPLYFITSDGASLSFKTVREEFANACWSIRNKCDDGWRVIGCDVNYEDSNLFCDHSGERIESAYGNDEEE